MLDSCFQQPSDEVVAVIIPVWWMKQMSPREGGDFPVTRRELRPGCSQGNSSVHAAETGRGACRPSLALYLCITEPMSAGDGDTVGTA